MDNSDGLIKIFLLAGISFVISMVLTPILTHFLYKYRVGKQIRADGDTPVFSALHEKKRGTPTMGGILIWGTTTFLILFLAFFAKYSGIRFFEFLNFFSRQQTLLPLGAMLASAFIGLMDDYLGAKGIGTKGGGIRIRNKLVLYSVIAAGGAYWFYYKLGFSQLFVPGIGNFDIGIWYIPLFIFVVIATSFSLDLTDGLDGLAGGVSAIAFFSFGLIAYLQGRFDLAGFIAVIIGSLLAFLWFNIYPARFFMGDTGSMALGTTIAVIAFLTNSVLVLPLIGFVMVMESASVIIQIGSRKLLGRKVFLSAPVHHHFEAKGWPETKVTMRFWLISAVMAVIGIAINLI